MSEPMYIKYHNKDIVFVGLLIKSMWWKFCPEYVNLQQLNEQFNCTLNSNAAVHLSICCNQCNKFLNKTKQKHFKIGYLGVFTYNKTNLNCIDFSYSKCAALFQSGWNTGLTIVSNRPMTAVHYLVL